MREAGRRWRVVELTPRFDSIVHLELALLDGDFRFEAGQYCFLRVGRLSDVEWHPFTLSGAPSDRRIQFDIKAMGAAHTFAARLLQLAEDRVDLGTLDIAVEGPYGCALDYAQHDAVLLVAGGIGVTPVHSVFRELYIRADGPTVTLLWVARHCRCFDLFGATLRAAAADPRDGATPALICTSTAESPGATGARPTRTGASPSRTAGRPSRGRSLTSRRPRPLPFSSSAGRRGSPPPARRPRSRTASIFTPRCSPSKILVCVNAVLWEEPHSAPRMAVAFSTTA